MAELKLQLEKVHLDERKKEEVELKAAQQRKAAIEDLEKGVCCLYCFMPVLEWSILKWSVLEWSVLEWSILKWSILEWSILKWSVLEWSVLKWSVLKWSILKHAMRKVCVVCVATYLSYRVIS